MKYILSIVIMLLFILPMASVTAQSDAEDLATATSMDISSFFTYISEDGLLTLEYPSDWEYANRGQFFVLRPPEEIFSGIVRVGLIIEAITEDTTVSEALVATNSFFNHPLTENDDRIIVGQIGDYDVAWAYIEPEATDDVLALMIVVEADNGFVPLRITTRETTFDGLDTAVFELIETLQYTAEPTTYQTPDAELELSETQVSDYQDITFNYHPDWEVTSVDDIIFISTEGVHTIPEIRNIRWQFAFLDDQTINRFGIQPEDDVLQVAQRMVDGYDPDFAIVSSRDEIIQIGDYEVVILDYQDAVVNFQAQIAIISSDDGMIILRMEGSEYRLNTPTAQSLYFDIIASLTWED